MIVKAQVKPDRDWKEYQTRTVAELDGFKSDPSIAVSPYGGRADVQCDASGFFRVEKRGDRFWIIDPDGHPFIHVAVVAVRPGKSEAQRAAFAARYRDEAEWGNAAARLLADHCFNGTGAWSDPAIYRARPRMVYTCIWNFMSAFGRSLGIVHQEPGHVGYGGGVIPVFHPDFPAFCRRHAEQLAPLRDDPWCVGHFSDNEMPLRGDMLDRHLALDADDPVLCHGHAAATTWLAERKGAAAGVDDVTDDDREAFRELVCDRYFEVTTAAIRAADPNHCCLGSRFHGQEKTSPGAFRAAGRHLDIVAVNYYGSWGPDPELVRNWAAWSGRPFMVTEFYTKGADAGFANTTGAGWIVPTQADRARFYQHFTMGLLESGACVGWHWFKYMDNDPSDLTTDPSNRDSNKGIVTIAFEEYADVLNGMVELNKNVYALCDHFDRARRGNEDHA